MAFEQVLADVQQAHNFNFTLKKEQFISLMKLVDGRSIFGQLPTGFGKSLIYTLYPLIMEKIKCKKQTPLVISPLKALIKDQAKSLESHNISTACLISDMHAESITAIRNGNVSIILASPESAMLCMDELTSGPLVEQLCLLCFDEAHCISQWGLDFRPDYRKVSDIVSIFGDIPTLVLTATATEKVFWDICNILALPEDTKLVASLPDRPNIYLHVERVVERYEEVLRWLIQHIKQNQLTTKKIIIYCNNIRCCENIYMWLLEELGDNAYIGKKSSSNRIIEMLHSRTDHCTSERILDIFPKHTSMIRVVVATVAFGMGVQIKDVDVIIHWGVTETLTYWQEVGRCARDGRQGLALTYAYSRSVTLCDEQIMKSICSTDNSSCIRSQVLDQFILPGMTPSQSEEKMCDGTCQKCYCSFCKCCSNCMKKCKCDGKFQNVIDRLN